MPVRSLKQSVWHWPAPDQVLNDVRVWAQQQQRRSPSLEHVGVFGSYGRGTAAFGSDLDLILVLTPAELEQRLNDGSRMATELRRDLRWLL